MQPIRNTSSENIRAQSVELLTKPLMAAIDLRGQVKRAHWNVSYVAPGNEFFSVSEPAQMRL
jgi:DNA-binding ferritin-like protein